MPTQRLDPDDHKGRLYKQTTKLYERLENDAQIGWIDLAERVQLLMKIEEGFVKFGKENDTVAGTTVRKYSRAFDATRRRAADARGGAAAAAADTVPWADDDDDGD